MAAATPTSPLVSSPGDSRAASPRARRRPSRDRSPPPPAPPAPPAHPGPPHEPLQPALAHLVANFDNLNVGEVSAPATLSRPSLPSYSRPFPSSPVFVCSCHPARPQFDSFTMFQMRHSIGDERLRELAVQHQYRSLEKLNGVRRRAGAFCPPPLSSSDSGSSAPPSPPGTPAPPPRRATPSAPPPVPFLPYQRPFAYPTPPPPAFRAPPPPFANGEPPHYPTPPQYAGFMPVVYAPPKLSCWNCGAAGHAGHECKEPSMEEMTRAGGYQLDYEPADK